MKYEACIPTFRHFGSDEVIFAMLAATWVLTRYDFDNRMMKDRRER